jgi:hypothetical protein
MLAIVDSEGLSGRIVALPISLKRCTAISAKCTADIFALFCPQIALISAIRI